MLSKITSSFFPLHSVVKFHQTSDITTLFLQVLNKIDLPGAEPDRVIREIEEVVTLIFLLLM